MYQYGPGWVAWPARSYFYIDNVNSTNEQRHEQQQVYFSVHFTKKVRTPLASLARLSRLVLVLVRLTATKKAIDPTTY